MRTLAIVSRFCYVWSDQKLFLYGMIDDFHSRIFLQLCVSALSSCHSRFCYVWSDQKLLLYRTIDDFHARRVSSDYEISHSLHCQIFYHNSNTQIPRWKLCRNVAWLLEECKELNWFV